ncbi:cupin domain-containing protein [Nocardia sp. CA-151230]|uniref:cupin domain-containing protein n=1 Tax=Nocardia sp. CA-151230 TaxID=3239982 RepID=UPI003D93E5A1
MAKPGDVLTIPGTDFTLRFITTGEETDGELLVTEWSAPIWSGPPPHWHKSMTESFHVLSGVMTFTLNGVTRSLKAGDSVTINPGEHHDFSNDGPDILHWRQENRPALQHEELFELFHAIMLREGIAGAPQMGEAVRLFRYLDGGISRSQG